jgi:hypothetical protein
MMDTVGKEVDKAAKRQVALGSTTMAAIDDALSAVESSIAAILGGLFPFNVWVYVRRSAEEQGALLGETLTTLHRKVESSFKA